MNVRIIKLFSLVAVWACALCAPTTALAQNILRVADFTAAAGKEAFLPIYLENSDDIVGAQFDITLPYAKGASDVVLMDTRSNGHTFSLRKRSNTSYTVVVMSLQNKPLRGNAGLLMRFPIQIAEDAQAEDAFPVKLSNIVLTHLTGRNLATSRTSEATFTVLRTPTPDLVMTELQMTGAGDELEPNGMLGLSFEVRNQGTGESGDGWTEKVYLEDAMGQRVYVGSHNYGNTLDTNASVTRRYELTLPKVMKTDGEVRAVVELVPLKKTGELIADQGNNTTVSEDTKMLTKKLFLSESRIVLTEGKSKSVTLTRSGDWSMDETFTLSEQNTHGEMMLTLPSSVTIKAGKSGATFTVKADDNTTVNAQYRTEVKAEGNGYAEVSMNVDVEDNDNYALTLTTDKVLYTEGETVTLTATIGQVLDNDLKVEIGKTSANRFSPSVRSITIPAGQLSATVTTDIVDDNYPRVDETVTFTAKASGFETSKCVILVRDNDWPKLTATLSRPIVSEGDGYGATMLTITRVGNTVENLTVKVESNAGAELYFDSQYNIIPAGRSSVTIPVSVEDNSTVAGQRTWVLSVAALDAVTEKPAAEGSDSRCTVQLTVTDDDTDRVLKLQSNRGQLAEGGAAVTVTVSRNTTLGDAVVQLTCEDEQVVLSTPTVTIPQGKSSATFTAEALVNVTADDDHYCSVVAEAEGYEPTSCMFLVSDQTQPDGVLKDAPTLAVSEAYGGQTLAVTLRVQNQGTATLPADVPVRFFLTTDRVFRYTTYQSSPHWVLDNQRTTKAVAAGEAEEMTFTVPLPYGMEERQYYVFGWLNFVGETEELNKQNGMGATAPLYLRPPFVAEMLTTDRETYSQGNEMSISGRMDNAASGVLMEGKKVDIYVVDSRNDRKLMGSATLDNEGRFALTYTLSSNYGGSYGLGVCCEGDKDAEFQARFGVSALKIEKNYEGGVLTLNMTKGVATEGDLMVTNLGEEPLYNLSYRMANLPADWTVTLSGASTLQGGATTTVHYRIVPKTVSEGRNYMVGEFKVAGKNGEGVTVAESQLKFNYYSRAPQCQLTTNVSKKDGVKTTLYKQGVRQWTLEVANTGLAATGDITVECPTNTPWLTATTAMLASLEKDEQTTLTLTLTGREDMLVDGTYTSYVKLTPEHGAAISVPVKATVVSTDEGTLTVDVVDAYTLGADDEVDGPHVAGATVRLTNSLTKEVVATGTTGTDGLFTMEHLKEGTYYVYVTADDHYYAEKTVTVNPGEVNALEVFLNYQVVKMTYTVERTTVTDEYQTVLYMDIVPNVPQAIVVPTLPANWGCGLNTYSIRLTNKGRLTAYTPYLEFPTIDGYTFTVKSDYPDVLYPNESYDVVVEYEGPEGKAESYVGGIVMHYAYQLRGETHWSKEMYAAQVGCHDDVPIHLPGWGSGRSDDGNSSSSVHIPVTGGLVDLGGSYSSSSGIDFPVVNVRDYTQSVDNRVRLQFEQTFFLEREAFEGHLTVENLQMDGIEHITLMPTVKTTDGEDASDLFAINFVGGGKWNHSDNWTLDASETGKATVLYVPSKETAPTKPVNYLFGGTVTYRDVATGKLITQELMQTKLTVNPSPDLHLTYFVQRDFVSDDPLTEEVEPWEPVEFALLIQNKGAGEALNLRIETSDPEVVDNANNLPVQFTKLYTTVDGKAGNYNFNYLDLGRIAAGQNVMARWWFYSSVSAHVANYNAIMTKGSNYGREFDLITLDGVRELTRSVKGSLIRFNGGEGKMRRAAPSFNTTGNIFLLNTIEDEDNLPDYVMDSQGNGTEDLEIVSGGMSCVDDGEGHYVLNVKASREGWVYGVIHDPTNHSMNLVKVVRNSDGEELTDNVWQTHRTVLPDYTTIVDNRIHLADNIIGKEESYTLYYESIYRRGDVNHDGSVDISDVTTLVNNILGKDAADAYEPDVNQDGHVDISDVTTLVNIILGKEL